MCDGMPGNSKGAHATFEAGGGRALQPLEHEKRIKKGGAVAASEHGAYCEERSIEHQDGFFGNNMSVII